MDLCGDVRDAKAPRQPNVNCLPRERLRALAHAFPHRIEERSPPLLVLEEPPVASGSLVAVEDYLGPVPKLLHPLSVLLGRRSWLRCGTARFSTVRSIA